MMRIQPANTHHLARIQHIKRFDEWNDDVSEYLIPLQTILTQTRILGAELAQYMRFVVEP